MKRLASTSLLHGLLILFALLWLVPLFWMISTSLKLDSEIVRSSSFLPEKATLVNYANVLRKSAILQWTYNSFLVAIVTSVVVLALDAMAGFAFARIRFPGREVLFLLVLSTLMIPHQVLLIPLFILFKQLGLLNTYSSLILPKLAVPVGVFLMRQSFRGIPLELEEAATIDGCSRWGIFFRVMLPLVRPALSALAIFTFLGSWNNFLLPLILVSKRQMFTLPIGIATMTDVAGLEYGTWMAAASIASVPILIIFLLLQREFIKGITMTGIKG